LPLVVDALKEALDPVCSAERSKTPQRETAMSSNLNFAAPALGVLAALLSPAVASATPTRVLACESNPILGIAAKVEIVPASPLARVTVSVLDNYQSPASLFCEGFQPKMLVGSRCEGTWPYTHPQATYGRATALLLNVAPDASSPSHTDPHAAPVPFQVVYSSQTYGTAITLRCFEKKPQ
jgi:hypothetical protein